MHEATTLLVNKDLSKVELASDKMAIRFTLNGETIVAKCDADCCSHTWVESISLPAGGLPAKVLSVEDLNLPSQDKDGDLLQFYGLKITTDKGELILDYRNESNGYYGGSLSWPKDRYYGGVFGQNNSTEEWQEVLP